jgi:hypothetical protein
VDPQGPWEAGALKGNYVGFSPFPCFHVFLSSFSFTFSTVLGQKKLVQCPISRQGQGQTVLRPGMIRRELGRVSSSVAGRSPSLELSFQGCYYSRIACSPRDGV